MNPTRPHRLINPLTGEIKLVSAPVARRLLSYGWRKLEPRDFADYQSIVASYIVRKNRGQIVRH